MIEFSYNNHIKYGYDKVYDYQFRSSSDQTYSLQFSKAKHTVLSYKDECIRTAHLIKERAGNQPIWISYSGGIDSECVIRSFMEAGIPFNVATTKFKGELNEYDLYFARKFCRENNIELHEIQIDIEKFL